MRILMLLMIWFGLAATAHAKAPCKMLDAQTLSISAYIEKDMGTCIDALDLSQLEIVIVNTGGGDVQTAMHIGDLIAPYNPHMIIKKNCHSSCANYWLPLARKITFKPKARILLHGSIDEGMVKRSAEIAKEGDDLSFVQRIVDSQNDYADRHNIHRGWLLYRTDYQLKSEAFAPYLSGDVSVPKGAKTITHFLVNEPMLKSCLPDIEIEGFEKSYVAKADERRWKRLAKKGRVSTGTWQCVSDVVVAKP